ncbi:MAG: hypothetical protein ACRDZ3_12160 [Acidimicrobiia bacterium]
MRQAFAAARQARSPAVGLFIHADPRFEMPHGRRWGYDEFLRALESEIERFARPVLLVHGDLHEYRLDKPFMTYSQPRRHLANLTRVESFGPKGRLGADHGRPAPRGGVPDQPRAPEPPPQRPVTRA